MPIQSEYIYITLLYIYSKVLIVLSIYTFIKVLNFSRDFRKSSKSVKIRYELSTFQVPSLELNPLTIHSFSRVRVCFPIRILLWTGVTN